MTRTAAMSPACPGTATRIATAAAKNTRDAKVTWLGVTGDFSSGTSSTAAAGRATYLFQKMSFGFCVRRYASAMEANIAPLVWDEALGHPVGSHDGQPQGQTQAHMHHHREVGERPPAHRHPPRGARAGDHGPRLPGPAREGGQGLGF